MAAIECVREADVIDAVTTDRWDTELTDHIASCGICADLACVTRALQQEHAAAAAEVRVPGSGLVWWRMQLRARHDATRAAERPVALAQAIAAACGVVVAIALLTMSRPWLPDWMRRFSSVTNLVGGETVHAWYGTAAQWA